MITDFRFERPVTITSENPSRPAVITGLEIVRSAGLTFEKLEFAAPAATGVGAGNTNAFQIFSSTNIRFDRVNAHGDMNGSLATEVSGFVIRDSRDVSIQRSEFQHFHNAIGHTGDERLTISGNWFHDLRDDGIRGGGSSFVTISDNRFESMHPDADDTDHPDCIQFWTSNTTSPSHDLTITDNLYTRGSGRSVQGIFLGNEKMIPYESVTIGDNVFAGAGYNGIAVKLVKNLSLIGNTVARYPDITSRLRVIDSQDVVMRDNRAAEYGWTDDRRIPETNLRIQRSHDVVIGEVGDHGAALAARWRARHNPDNIH